MAPEVFAKLLYDGAKADLFSCGCMLFVMVAGFYPLETATEEDSLYSNFWISRPDLFWTAI
jgi:serine/threonine protein kinase